MVLDETGFLKRVGKSAGVKRQYSGTTGRSRPKRRQRMLQRAVAVGMPGATSDRDAWGGYVLAVTSAQRLRLTLEEDWLGDVLARACMTRPISPVASADRLVVWLVDPLQEGRAASVHVLFDRAPADTSLATPGHVAGQRWTIESCFEEAKAETGLHQYQVRMSMSCRWHIPSSMLAHADLTVMRQRAIGRQGTRRARGGIVALPSTRGAMPALASDVGAAAFGRGSRALVGVALASAACP